MCGGLTAGGVGTRAGCRVGSIEWSRSQRERGHFFGVSHCGERPGSLPAGLTALSRNVCDWRPGWGCVLSYSLCKHSTEARRRDLPRGLWRGISTRPHSMCLYFFSALLATTLHLTVHACVHVYRCGLSKVLGTDDEVTDFLSFESVFSDMAPEKRSTCMRLFLFFYKNYIITFIVSDI